MPPEGGSAGAPPGGTSSSAGTDPNGGNPPKKIFRGLFADVLAGKKRESSCSVNQIQPKKELVRAYRLNRMPPNGLISFIENKFKTASSATWNSSIVRGNSFYVLTVGFNKEGCAEVDCVRDYKEAATFQIKINDKTIKFTAIDAVEQDRNGTLIPRLAKNLILRNFPLALANAPEIVKDSLKEFCTFDKLSEVKLIKENGLYLGKAVIPVKKFTQIPPSRFLMPMVFYQEDLMGEDGKYTIEPDCFQEVFLTPLGFDKEGANKVPRAQNIQKRCAKCQSIEHLIADCPRNNFKKKYVGQKCLAPGGCGRFDQGCTRDECKNMKEIQEGNFVFKKPVYREQKSAVRFAEAGTHSTPAKASKRKKTEDDLHPNVTERSKSRKSSRGSRSRSIAHELESPERNEIGKFNADDGESGSEDSIERLPESRSKSKKKKDKKSKKSAEDPRK